MRFLFVMIFGCSLLSPGARKKPIQIDLNMLNFKIIGPLHLVDLLKNKDNRRSNVRLYFMNFAPGGWVSEKDLPGLMASIDNHDTCKCLVSPISNSYYPAGYSMINGQVADMINSFRDKKQHFPSGFYACSTLNSRKNNCLPCPSGQAGM